MTETTLDVIEFGVQQLLSEHFAIPPVVESERDIAIRMIELNVVQSILAQGLDEISAQYPANWREAFKERWWPKWAKERWPVARKTITLKLQALYPKMPLPDEPYSFYFSRTDW